MTRLLDRTHNYLKSHIAVVAGVAVRCCCCCGLGTRTHTRNVPRTSGWRVYIPRRGTHHLAAQRAGLGIYRLTMTERRLRETQQATCYHSGDSPQHKQGVGPPSTASVVPSPGNAAGKPCSCCCGGQHVSHSSSNTGDTTLSGNTMIFLLSY